MIRLLVIMVEINGDVHFKKSHLWNRMVFDGKTILKNIFLWRQPKYKESRRRLSLLVCQTILQTFESFQTWKIDWN